MDLFDQQIDAALIFQKAFFTKRIIDPVIHAIAGNNNVGLEHA